MYRVLLFAKGICDSRAIDFAAGDKKTQLGLLGLISSTRSTNLYVIYHVQKCVMVQSIIVCAAQECQQKATDQIRDVEIGGVLFRLYVCEDCLKKDKRENIETPTSYVYKQSHRY